MLSVVSWVAYSFFAAAIAPGNFVGALVGDSFVAIAAEGGSGLIAFFVIVVPSGALWGGIDGPFWIWLVVVLAFATLCIGIYLWFKVHPSVDEEPVEEGETESAAKSAAESVTGS